MCSNKWSSAFFVRGSIWGYALFHFLIVRRIIVEREDWEMEKTVVFDESDKALLEKIDAYQAQKGITFQEAVKELCEKGLVEKTELKWGPF